MREIVAKTFRRIISMLHVKRETLPAKYWMPKEGNDWNPVAKYPRNMPCFCGSGLKFKKCCMERLPETIAKEQAEDLQKHMKRIRDLRASKGNA